MDILISHPIQIQYEWKPKKDLNESMQLGAVVLRKSVRNARNRRESCIL